MSFDGLAEVLSFPGGQNIPLRKKCGLKTQTRGLKTQTCGLKSKTCGLDEFFSGLKADFFGVAVLLSCRRGIYNEMGSLLWWGYTTYSFLIEVMGIEIENLCQAMSTRRYMPKTRRIIAKTRRNNIIISRIIT